MMLAKNAQCLLLDEPTSAPDLLHQDGVLALLGELSHERRLTIVVVLHDINLAALYSDEIVALKNGRVFAHGTPCKIVRSDA